MMNEQAGWVLDPLNAEELKLSNPELGLRLIGHYVAAVAVEHDLVDSLGDPAFTQAVINQIPLAEAESAKNTAIEKALHKAAAEDFETAGRLVREHLTDGAHTLAIANTAISELAKRMKGPKAGGKKRAKQQKERTAERNARMAERYGKLEADELKKHEIIGQLSSEEGLDKSTTRKILNKTRVS